MHHLIRSLSIKAFLTLILIIPVFFSSSCSMDFFTQLSSKAENITDLEAEIVQLEVDFRKYQKGEGAPEEYKEALKAWEAYRKLQQRNQEERLRNEEEGRLLEKRHRDLMEVPEARKWHEKILETSHKLHSKREEFQQLKVSHGNLWHKKRVKELSEKGIAEVTEAHALNFTALNFPQVDGSTSARPLGLVIACKILETPYKWEGLGVYSENWKPELFMPGNMYLSKWKLEDLRIPVTYPKELELVSYIPQAVCHNSENREESRKCLMINHVLNNHAGTHGAYVTVINGYSDIGLVARAPSPDEIELAEEKNVKLTVTPVALDAFVFIRNYRCPVNALTTQEIRDIYAGKITQWTEFGGPNQFIRAYRRNRNSGSQELMESLIMKDTPFQELEETALKDLIHDGMGGPYIALTQDKYGIGYSVYYYEHFMAGSPDTRLMAVDGVMPSYESIASREYPYVTEVYAVVNSALPPDSPAIRLRDWLLTDEGQAVVRESGYVPIRDPEKG